MLTGAVSAEDVAGGGGPARIDGELVGNASMHANTVMTAQIRLRSCHVRIAVFDGSATRAVAWPAAAAGGGGRGPPRGEAGFTAGGSTSLAAGKVVWSALARPAAPDTASSTGDRYA